MSGAHGNIREGVSGPREQRDRHESQHNRRHQNYRVQIDGHEGEEVVS